MSETATPNVRTLDVGQVISSHTSRKQTPLAIATYRLSLWLRSPRPYLMLIGFALFLGFWYFAVEVWKLPRFAEMPGPTEVLREWFSKNPTYGLSVFTPEGIRHRLFKER